MPAEDPEGVLTDEELLKRTAAGEREAFDVLVARHQAAVFRFARAATGGPAAAEDVLQETFLAAWRAAGTFQGRSAVRTWLLTIARNQAWHHRERAGRLPADDAPLPELGEAAGWGAESPEEAVLRSERHARLARALEALVPEEREVLVLRDLEEMTGEETAAALGIGLAAMKSRLLDGELPEAEKSRLTEHVAGCEVCERFGRRFATVVGELREGLREPELLEAGIAERLRARMVTR